MCTNIDSEVIMLVDQQHKLNPSSTIHTQQTQKNNSKTASQLLLAKRPIQIDTNPTHIKKISTSLERHAMMTPYSDLFPFLILFSPSPHPLRFPLFPHLIPDTWVLVGDCVCELGPETDCDELRLLLLFMVL